MSLRSWPLPYTAIVLMLAGTCAVASWTDHRPGDALIEPLGTLDRDIAGWSGAVDAPFDDATLQSLRPTSYLSRVYRRPGRELGLLVAYYANQRAGESMHSPKNCLPGTGWEVWDYGSVDVPVNGKPIRVNLYAVQKETSRMRILYWYQSRKRIFASEYDGKYFLLRDSLLDGVTSGALVRIALHDHPTAVADGVRFASEVMPMIQDRLGGAGEWERATR